MEKITDYLMPFVMAGLMFIVSWQEGKREETLAKLEATHTAKQVDSLQAIVNNQNVELINNRIQIDKYNLARDKFREFNPLSAQEYENIYNSIETQWEAE